MMYEILAKYMINKRYLNSKRFCVYAVNFKIYIYIYIYITLVGKRDDCEGGDMY